MVIKRKKIDFKRLALVAAEAALDKKALDVRVLDIHKESDVADFVLIAEAGSTAQMRALEGSIEEAFRDQGLRVLRREGRTRDRWIAMDFGGLMVHIMMSEARAFYRLESLWEKAKVIPS